MVIIRGIQNKQIFVFFGVGGKNNVFPPQARERHKQLVLQLQTLSSGPQSTAQSCREVLEYFFEKLTSSQLTPRMLALKVRALNTEALPQVKVSVH